MGDELLARLERRLDNVVYRLGLASTRAQARQFVTHRHVLVERPPRHHPVLPRRRGARRRAAHQQPGRAAGAHRHRDGLGDPGVARGGLRRAHRPHPAPPGARRRDRAGRRAAHRRVLLAAMTGGCAAEDVLLEIADRVPRRRRRWCPRVPASRSSPGGCPRDRRPRGGSRRRRPAAARPSALRGPGPAPAARRAALGAGAPAGGRGRRARRGTPGRARGRRRRQRRPRVARARRRRLHARRRPRRAGRPVRGRLLGVDLHWRCAHELAALTLGVAAARAERAGDLDLALRVVRARMTLPVEHGEVRRAGSDERGLGRAGRRDLVARDLRVDDHRRQVLAGPVAAEGLDGLAGLPLLVDVDAARRRCTRRR